MRVHSSRVTPEDLRSLFHPRSIALVGATDNSRWSIFTFNNLKERNFSGPIHCVHPTREVVHGQPAFRSLLDIPEPVDLAYIMVPSHAVLQVMEEAHRKGIRNLVMLTAGFRETGEAGAKLEEQVLAYAASHGQVLLGPNGNGFVNLAKGITPYGLPIPPALPAGPVGIVLQSGALASQVMALALARNIGISLLVSMGNESMISATDVMDYLIEDDSTRVIALFLETIRSPQEFSRVARRAQAAGKPIVALKIGRSVRSAQTAMAHTGALVGDDRVNDAALRQLGVIRVHSLEDLITTAGLLGYAPPLPGRRMGVVTPSGGACDILSDRAEDEGILLPDFAVQTVARLREVLPAFSTPHNPLDVTGYVVVDQTLLQRALTVVADDPNVDFILCLTDPPRVPTQPPEAAYQQVERLRQIVDGASKPIVLMSNTSVDITEFGRAVLNWAGLHVVGGMEHGMTALGRLLWWQEQRARRVRETMEEEVMPSLAMPADAVGYWSEERARSFLREAGIPVVPGVLARSADEAAAAVRMLGAPVAMKIQSPDIAHKSDVGGVRLDVGSEAQAREVYERMIWKIHERMPDSRLDGVLVTPMRTGGVELLVGVVRDPLWGPVMAVGLGGVFVEVLRDTSLRVLPVGPEDIRDMLAELRGAAILRGVRGGEPADVDRLVAVIHRISRIAVAAGEGLQALEINPLYVRGSQVEALDALVTWKT
ncbi:acetate--CoA ligase family protein [Alicyclobacillus sp.]|uniref:acetate--CoA ligase family protein n=1 Tax=Alicyclobacillus sp. TaxID=61169 RepID=UPI0025C36E44|nr:acetate--CoA ligase family protein [Alicyclobacillus sp.]MCL6517006.1 acetate--CoA ligase family protein [Alicyclobacillus sp.]